MTGIKRLYGMACALRWYTWGQSLSKELEEIYKQIKSEQAEDHEIAEWVRERGGLELVKNRDEFTTDIITWIRRVSGVTEEEAVDVDEAMTEIDSRLAPCGVKWPKVDGEKVDFTTAYDSIGVLEAVEIYNNGACNVMSHDGIVKSVSDIHVAKQDPIGADGLPIKKGEITYLVSDGREAEVRNVSSSGVVEVVARRVGIGNVIYVDASQLTHTKPEPSDSWERIYSDCDLTGEQYVDELMDEQPDDMTPEMAKAHDLVRRAEELAKRERD